MQVHCWVPTCLQLLMGPLNLPLSLKFMLQPVLAFPEQLGLAPSCC